MKTSKEKQPPWCEMHNAATECWSLLFYKIDALSKRYCEECEFAKHYIGDEERNKRWAERRARVDANK